MQKPKKPIRGKLFCACALYTFSILIFKAFWNYFWSIFYNNVSLFSPLHNKARLCAGLLYKIPIKPLKFVMNNVSRPFRAQSRIVYLLSDIPSDLHISSLSVFLCSSWTMQTLNYSSCPNWEAKWAQKQLPQLI